MNAGMSGSEGMSGRCSPTSGSYQKYQASPAITASRQSTPAVPSNHVSRRSRRADSRSRRSMSLSQNPSGGAQERQRRAGTHNVPGIVGLGKAVELAKANMAERSAYETKLRDHLIERVTSEIPYTRLNGHRTDRLPNNANFCFRFIEGESMLILLDQAGVCGSSGSACTSGSLDPSHVLLAIGLPHEIAHGSLRLTLSEKTTLEDIDYTVDKLKEIIARLRSMSPLYEDFVKKNGKSEA